MATPRSYSLAAQNDEAEFATFGGRTETGIAFQIVGTWSGTITFQATVDGTNYVSILATNVTNDAQATTTTANGIFRIIGDGLTSVRARMTSYSSGTATVVAQTARGAS